MKLIRDMGIQKVNPLILEWEIVHIQQGVRIVKREYKNVIIEHPLKWPEIAFTHNMPSIEIMAMEKDVSDNLYLYCKTNDEEIDLYVMRRSKNSNEYQAQMKFFNEVLQAHEKTEALKYEANN
jgi:hypothetical protein